MRFDSNIKEKELESVDLIAKTHPAEYLIHKYWARKPHNILSSYIKKYFSPNDIIVDPFVGSGVFLAEAKKQNCETFGFDINPIAALLSDVTTNPPNVNDLKIQISSLINYATEKYSNLYLINNKKIRYLTHYIVTKCPSCGKEYCVTDALKQGNSYYCSNCNSKLSFNFENMMGTKILKIIDIDNHEYNDDCKDFCKQKQLSNECYCDKTYDKELVTNRRILAFPGMKHSDLFTNRAYMILTDLFKQVEKVDDLSVKKALQLFLTSCVAQCSRLIPYRNNLSTGGPAWTMPGFWIAPVHLETNPLIHMEARFKKFIKGISALNDNYKNIDKISKIYNMPMQEGLNKFEDGTISGIFFDPPYGDNVPYLEFSAIWNNFIENNINYGQEIIVSDRKIYKSGWDKYQSDINNAIYLFAKKLKSSGKVIMTFNNLNPKAWQIIIDSFNKNSLYCINANYQIPAVVSTKSQMASNTSYIGDFYCVFEKNNKKMCDINLFELTNLAKRIILCRGDKVPKNLVYRTLILLLLKKNIDSKYYALLDDAIKPIATSDKEYFYIRPECIDNKVISLKQILIDTAQETLIKGKQTIESFYKEILKNTTEIGTPPLQEVKFLLNGYVLFDKEYCYLQTTQENQLSLF